MRPATDISRLRTLVAGLAISLAGCGAMKPTGDRPASPMSAATAVNGVDRRQRAKAAGDNLMRLHFFAEGRGMHMTSGLTQAYNLLSWTGVYNGFVRNRWGVGLQDGRVAGLQHVNHEGTPIGVAGCAVCHSGSAAGVFVPGLGNKNIDPTMLAADVLWMQKLHEKLPFSDRQSRDVDASALAFARRVSNREIGNLTQGLVPTAVIWEWFFAQAQQPMPAKLNRGAVKVPHFWGFGEKRKAGLFCDGIGDGREPGWLMGVELAARQEPATIRTMKSKLHAAVDTFSALLPPDYPFSIDRDAASRGAKVFDANCRECHGSHRRDSAGLPVYRPPKWLPLQDVGTDSDRVATRTARLDRLVDRNPLRDLMERNPTSGKGYLAPRLDGIWCRFPYLHNGSVPGIASLLDPPPDRPVAFSLRDAGERKRFDEHSLGLTVPGRSETEGLLRRGSAGDRTVYDTRREGQSNRGHAFGSSLSAEEKRTLIEYLKTL